MSIGSTTGNRWTTIIRALERRNTTTCKVIEIRDRGTHIEAMAIRMQTDNPAQECGIHYRGGHPRNGSSIVLMRLHDLRATNDPYEWPHITGDGRTMPNAHDYILTHFDEIKDGDVVDVEYILGESSTPKMSENNGYSTVDAQYERTSNV